MTTTILQSLAGLTIILLVRWAAQRREQKRKGSHPPGPPGLPLLGNLLDMPDNPSWTTYIRWSEEYDSDILRLNVLGSNIIIVNSLEAANDLLDKRSAIYSDRPEMPMLNDLCEFGWNVAFRRYDDSWRNGRRVFQHELGPQVVKRFRSLEEQASHQFLRSLLREPTAFMNHLRHMAGYEIMRIAYGIEVADRDDPYVDTAEHAVGAVVATCSPGSYLVNIMPFLKHIPEWFPGAKFQRDAKVWRKYVTELRDKPFGVVKEHMRRGDAPDCAAKFLLESLESGDDAGDYTENDIKFALGSMYAGGSDTTVSALGSFILGVVLNPEIQTQAQEAIDRVCPDRLPTFADQDDLPYIDAIVKESLRWNPVLPIDVAHCSIADDVYRGYYIPKGSLVLANSWCAAILHDEQAYPDPLRFNPDRFMKDGKLDPSVREPDAAFGFGRRVCPGRYLAYEAIWIAVACMLAVFNLSKAKDEHGMEITPSGEYNVGFACYPKPFPCDIRPRSSLHEALIRATADES
ncbi:uncharacterized protein PHACADRAFT_119876 [Phanerochaete carnosa HHB-10118-sp]|uniref:Cytochrome P450 n=1 Tax=Phanerochaete carnosa (strain HHB-10118-sp) TaxID=650164 RepID=K5W754_PHACS|nr:uncharacterized protein PHACADRAFT_119876 [Phanerochaete carnosa HHB-10118-sp]EKM54990.1 hypothetical protein PHACADRAFT_119876 [Phanerochaete carnosa HHB-10118-sp]